MPNNRFGYSVKKNSFKGLNIDFFQYSNIIRITYYSYSYSVEILIPNNIRIRIRSKTQYSLTSAVITTSQLFYFSPDYKRVGHVHE